jgi:hypothetical protein
LHIIFLLRVKAEEGFIEGLSADEILNGDFETGMEYVNDQRTIDQVIADAGTADGAATEAGHERGHFASYPKG